MAPRCAAVYRKLRQTFTIVSIGSRQTFCKVSAAMKILSFVRLEKIERLLVN